VLAGKRGGYRAERRLPGEKGVCLGSKMGANSARIAILEDGGGNKDRRALPRRAK
jgi:hypothetical protein